MPTRRWRSGITGATSPLSLGGSNVPRPCLPAISRACYRIICKFGYTQTVPMDDPELLTVSQAAEAFNATSQTIRNWIRSDRIRAVRIGNRFLIPREEVDRLRGDLSAPSGESLWEYSPDDPPEPLRRKSSESRPHADPAEGLLGA